MNLKLEELKYQEAAINSIVRLFEGQEKNTFGNSYDREIQSNLSHLTKAEINENKKDIIHENGIEEAHLSDDNEYCIEMETGTGKTLVYIRTIYELYKTYGFSRFIILVPSIAIKEGVIKTFATFEQQLENIYGFSPKYFAYDSKKLNNVRHFIQDSQPQVMIMTVQSFSTNERIINQAKRDDSFLGLSYIEALGATQPIVFMDEPQEGMDTANAGERIKTLNPLCKIRYSATHKVVKNLMYRLMPYDAYRKGLVKKIEVLSVAEKNDEATLKIEIKDVQVKQGQWPKIKLKLWMTANGAFAWKETPWLKQGDNLGEKSGNISYHDYTIERIYKNRSDRKFRVKFSNGTELIESNKSVDFEGIFRIQLEWLIRRHIQKKQFYKKKGIKCLSLIFIDRVNNYMAKDGIIRQLFYREYARVHRELIGEEVSPGYIESIQGYYFARTGQGTFTDNEYSMTRNKEIFDLILRDKNRLLDMNNPVEFIFSHSALGVGWHSRQAKILII
ncbi:MAG: DEAD/DEAH box helicase family protein [Bacteroidales bacterium]|nr:DEAD/DEAH box helicase family protein [Bacteroidales bacterium]MCF8333677.1 DEAD/DEAH box helicase family protein [Bacteroidales bacterium]